MFTENKVPLMMNRNTQIRWGTGPWIQANEWSIFHWFQKGTVHNKYMQQRLYSYTEKAEIHY